MVFWLAVAMLAAAVTYAVTRPLMMPSREGQPGADDSIAADLAVYKDQLQEIESDLARGALSATEAQAARNEVARRLIRRSESGSVDEKGSSAQVGALSKWAFSLASVFLPVASLGLYLAFGQPGQPGQPLSARIDAPVDATKTNDLVAKVEAALRDRPDDGKGWDVIAPVYMKQGRFQDAATAYAKAINLLGENPTRLQGFVDARIRAENGLIPDDVRAALEKLRIADPSRREPRMWLALAKEQDGDRAGAAADYRALLADAPADAPWRTAVEQRLALVTGASAPQPNTGPEKIPSANAPSEADMMAMTPQQREAKINEMVDGLAARLKTDAKDLTGWQRLIRAYQALGRKDEALKAVSDARAGLAGDDASLRQLDEWVKQLGLAG
ncbi:MAG: c-type cytochrome biogenesis protein CcmI [Hyphomicrobium sp.]|nr:MAG: c-type cytochrome biogenesis protein CcmI [Hyphomicrobium sp.]PPC99823.1 MAG: c-type cytochrome biogenesis protein CcmI [Hyphomicrobium sp.]